MERARPRDGEREGEPIRASLASRACPLSMALSISIDLLPRIITTDAKRLIAARSLAQKHCKRKKRTGIDRSGVRLGLPTARPVFGGERFPPSKAYQDSGNSMAKRLPATGAEGSCNSYLFFLSGLVSLAHSLSAAVPKQVKIAEEQ